MSRPPPGDLPNPGSEPSSPELQTDSLPTEPLGSVLTFFVIIILLCGKMLINIYLSKKNVSLSTMRYHLIVEVIHQSEWPSSKNLQTVNAREDVEKMEPFCTVGGNVN